MRTRYFQLIWAVVLGACGGAPAAKVEAPAVPVTEVSRYAPFENKTVFSYETYIEDTNERGIIVFEINRPRPELAELSVAGQVRKRYYFEVGGIRSSTGGYLLKSPLTPNATWQGDDGPVRVAAMNESLSLPAGKFEGCLKTIEEAKLGAATRTTTTEFCPGVGIATLQIEGEQEGMSVLQALRLKSFGPRFTGP